MNFQEVNRRSSSTVISKSDVVRIHVPYQPDDIVLTQLPDGYCHVRNADLGVHLFTDMVASGRIKPSIYTLATMVKLDGMCGRCDDAVSPAGKMEEQLGLQPSVVIFTCIMSGRIRDGTV